MLEAQEKLERGQDAVGGKDGWSVKLAATTKYMEEENDDGL